MEGTACIVSLDTVVILGRARDLSSFLALLDAYEEARPPRRKIVLHNYARSAYAPDGTRICTQYSGLGDCEERVRVEILPNRCDPVVVADILSRLGHVRVSQVDIALDFIGKDVRDYDFSAAYLGYTRHELQRNPVPHSYLFGSRQAARKIAVYDKIEQLKSKRSSAYRIVDVLGEITEINVADYEQNNIPWLRVEVRLSGSWIHGSEPKMGAFNGFVAKRRVGVVLDCADMRTDAMLHYLSDYPEQIKRLNKNTQAKYRRLQRQMQADAGLSPHPQDVLTQYHGYICAALEMIATLGSSGGDGHA